MLTLPAINCVHKESGGCKISSGYFNEMISIARYKAYQPISTSHGQCPCNPYTSCCAKGNGLCRSVSLQLVAAVYESAIW